MSGAVSASQTLARGVGLAFAAAGAAIIAAGSQAVQVLAEEERLLAQTTAAIKSTGGAAQVTARHIVDLSNSMEGLTTIDNAVIQGAANLMLTFTNVRNEIGKNNDVFDQAIKQAANMSVALGTDAKSAAMQLGKALNDPAEGMAKLARAGVQFTDDQKKMVKQLQESGDMLGAQKIILAELEKQFGGSAEAVRGTFTGAMTNLENVLEDLNKGIFAGALPVMTEMINGIADSLSGLTDAVTDGGLMGGIDHLFGPEMKIAIAAIGGAITASLIPAAQAAAVSLYGMATAALAAMAPLAPFAIAGAALGAVALVIAANWRELADFFSMVWQGAVGAAQATIQGFTDWARNTFNTISNFVTSSMRGIADFFARAWAGAVSAGGGSLSRFVEFANTIIFALQDGFERGLNAILSLFGRWGNAIADRLGNFASDWARGMEIMGLGDFVANWKSGFNTIMGNLRSMKNAFVSIGKTAAAVPAFGGGVSSANVGGGAGGSGAGKSGSGGGAAGEQKKSVDALAEAIKNLNKQGEQLREREAALGESFNKSTEWANFYTAAVNALISAGAKSTDTVLKQAIAGQKYHATQAAITQEINNAAAALEKINATPVKKIELPTADFAAQLATDQEQIGGWYNWFMESNNTLKTRLDMDWGEIAKLSAKMAGEFIGSLESMGVISEQQADYISDAFDGLASAVGSFTKFAASGFTDFGAAISGAITLMKTLTDLAKNASRDIIDMMTGGAVSDADLISSVMADTKSELDAIARKEAIFGDDFDAVTASINVYEDALAALSERFDESNPVVAAYLAHFKTLKTLMDSTAIITEDAAKSVASVEVAADAATAGLESASVAAVEFSGDIKTSAKSASGSMQAASNQITESVEAVAVEMSEAEKSAKSYAAALGEISKRQLIYGDDPLEQKIRALQDYMQSYAAGSREFIALNEELKQLTFQRDFAAAQSTRNSRLFESARQMASGLSSVVAEAINGTTFAFDTFAKNLQGALKSAISNSIATILQEKIIFKQLQPLLRQFAEAVEGGNLDSARGMVGGIFQRGAAIASELSPIITELRNAFAMGEAATIPSGGAGGSGNAITVNINGPISSNEAAENAAQAMVRQLIQAGLVPRY